MNVHKNARLTRHGRERIVRQVESVQTPEAIAEAAGVCPRTVRKWVGRYRREGVRGLDDRSSRPHRLRRYEREHPGELIHLIKKLGRIGSVGHRITGRQTGVVNRHLGIGWEFVHVCIDDASRVAFAVVQSEPAGSLIVAIPLLYGLWRCLW